MKILTNTGGLAQTNAYLVADEHAKQAVLVDAPDHTITPLLDEAAKAGWDVTALWLTHGHFDHIADHDLVTRRFPAAQVLIHTLDEPKLINPDAQRLIFPFPLHIPPRRADALLEDGQTLTLGRYAFNVIFTPGHSPGHVAFHCPSENVLLGGDLIICGAVGRTDLPESSEPDLFSSLRRIMQLPPQTRLLPGHCNPSTLSHELQTNPHVHEALNRA
jgi:glyoxylase-like metal-dependent hydrolase (beta-lactamase superfamily II)